MPDDQIAHHHSTLLGPGRATDRFFADHNDTGIAVAIPGGLGVEVTLEAFQKDGSSPAGNGAVVLRLGGNGHKAAFAGQLISGLPDDFTGVLDISSPDPFVALTLRSVTNRRGDHDRQPLRGHRHTVSNREIEGQADPDPH